MEYDIPRLDASVKKQIRAAIERKLTQEPRMYGKPLRYSKKGSWSLRVGDYRVIFIVSDTIVLISAIGHRKDVYER